MGKENRGKDIYKRINYLYQAAFLCLRTTPHDLQLCKFYISTLKSVVKKGVIRLHPSMKRALCKKCCTLLVPGVTAKVRLKSKRQKHTIVHCLECGFFKRYIIDPGKKLWFDDPQAFTHNVGKQKSGKSKSNNSNPTAQSKKTSLELKCSTIVEKDQDPENPGSGASDLKVEPYTETSEFDVTKSDCG